MGTTGKINEVQRRGERGHARKREKKSIYQKELENRSPRVIFSTKLCS